MIPLLAGLGALVLLGNPPRRKRRRKNPETRVHPLPHPDWLEKLDNWGEGKGYRMNPRRKRRRNPKRLASNRLRHLSYGLPKPMPTPRRRKKRGSDRLRHLAMGWNPRVSKTEVLYIIQGHYGQGWEDVDADEYTSEGRKRIRENLRLYRENEPQYAHRLIKRRVPKS